MQRPHQLRRGKHFILSILCVAVFALATAGCGAKKPKIVPPKTHATLGFWVDGDKPPMSGCEVVRFKKELITPNPIPLTQTSVLEFLPISDVNRNETRDLEVFLVIDGGEVSLGRYRCYSAGPVPAGPSDSRSLLSRIVRIELGQHAGEEAQIKWVAVNGAPDEVHGVGMFKVYKKAGPNPPPNILFICSDTHRFDYSIAGEGPELMPTLTEFRKEAMTYSRAYSDATWTLPSITSTFSGRNPRFHQTGRRTATIPDPRENTPEDRPGQFWVRWGEVARYLSAYPTEGVRLFTEDLQKDGYFTAWVVGNLFYVLPGMHEKGQDIVLDYRRLNGREITDAAAKVIEALPSDRPSFLLVHYLDVHQYRLWKLDSKKPEDDVYTMPRERLLNVYRESVRESDAYLSELLALWKARFGFENSMIVFWSDHGEHLRDPGYPSMQELVKERGESIESWNLDIPLVDHGNSMDEVLLHVPLVIRYPDALGIRGQTDAPVALVDLYPTVLQVSGVQPVEGHELDGESLLKIHETGAREGPIHADYQLYGAEMSSVRDGSVKYVVQYDQNGQAKGDYLVDTTLPYAEKGEFGQRIENEELRASMSQLLMDYAEAAENAAKGIKSDYNVDSSKASKDLEAQGYFNSKKN